MTDPLVARFEALLVDGRPDWVDVRRRARLSRRPLLIAAAAVVLFVAAPLVAVGVRLGVLPWKEAQPAPRLVVQRFAAFDRAVREHVFVNIQGQTPFDLGILAGQARRVPLAGGAVAFVAPERSGVFCVFFETAADLHSHAIDCQPGRDGRLLDVGLHMARRPLLGLPVEERTAYVHGHALGDSSSTVEIEFDDETQQAAPVTWVGPPISAGIFFTRLPSGHRLTAVVFGDAQGRELARDTHLAAIYALEKRFGGMPGSGSGSNPPSSGGFRLPGSSGTP